MLQADKLIDSLQLIPHPEGGYYKETYRSAFSIYNQKASLRNCSTAIYYLLQDREVSKFHRIQSDEIWYFHQGSALELLLIVENELQVVLLGNNIENGETPQTVIPANTWFASRVKNSEGHSLMSCSVAPGFDFMDFEMAERPSLLQEFPHLNETIIELT